jgi:hypothetical protein
MSISVEDRGQLMGYVDKLEEVTKYTAVLADGVSDMHFK